MCVFSGYVENKYGFRKNNNEYHFDFFVSVENDDGVARPVPFRCTGDMAIEVYSKLQVGYYVEITSKFVRIDRNTHYFVVKDLMYKAPKTSNQYYIKSSQLLEMFNPKNVIERLEESGEK